jgi:hypothetical protein
MLGIFSDLDKQASEAEKKDCAALNLNLNLNLLTWVLR